MESKPVTTPSKVAKDPDSGLNETLYLALARHRRQTGTKQYEVAARLGVSPSELCRWVYCGSRPTQRQAMALARTIKVPPAALFPDFASLKDEDPAGQPGFVTTSAEAGGGDDSG